MKFFFQTIIGRILCNDRSNNFNKVHAPMRVELSRKSTLARDHLISDVPTAHVFDSVKTVLAQLKKRKYTFKEAVIIVSSDKTFLGYVEFLDLLTAPDEASIPQIIKHCKPITLDTDEEFAAGFAVRHKLNWVPVVSDEKQFKGVIPSQEIHHILRAEHIEDLHLLAGIQKEERRALGSFESVPIRRVRHRLPWLILGLAISSISAYAIANYERILSENFAVIMFLPAIVYLADAIGTQTEAIVVRGVSLSHLSFSQMFWGEMRTGALLGFFLGIISFATIYLLLQDWRISMGVGVSLLCSGFVATAFGFLFPWVLNAMGKDPALGSGPIATVLQDTLSVIIYFQVMDFIMR